MDSNQSRSSEALSERLIAICVKVKGVTVPMEVDTGFSHHHVTHYISGDNGRNHRALRPMAVTTNAPHGYTVYKSPS